MSKLPSASSAEACASPIHPRRSRWGQSDAPWYTQYPSRHMSTYTVIHNDTPSQSSRELFRVLFWVGDEGPMRRQADESKCRTCRDRPEVASLARASHLVDLSEHIMRPQARAHHRRQRQRATRADIAVHPQPTKHGLSRRVACREAAQLGVAEACPSE